MSVHIEAQHDQVAETVLLPGDPLRAKFIADNYLRNVKTFNKVRNMFGFTGFTAKDKRISVLGTGMGMPSLSIYVHELINSYDAKKLIRVGSCGSLQEEVQLKDVVLAQGSCTDSAINKLRFKGMDFAPLADFELLSQAVEAARNLNIPVKVGNILATDLFYNEANPNDWQHWAKYGVLAVEMETAELYTKAAYNWRKQVKALTILTVSDSLITREHLSAEERATTFTDMVKIIMEIV